MRPSIRAALEHSAELTRNLRLVEALQVGEAAVHAAADAVESAEIRQWLTDHADDFTRED